MGNRVAMVSDVNLSIIKNQSHSLYGTKTDIETNVFEAGMVEVLKDLGKMHFLKHDIQNPTSIQYEESNEESVGITEKFLATLTDEQRELFDDYEDAESLCGFLQLQDTFITGFIQGYQFLKQLKESFKEG